MTSFGIKVIACITMILDHIKYAIPVSENFVTLYLGRLSFPLFAFLIVQGYIHTSDLKKYYKRLLVFGIISQIPFMMFRTLVGEWKLLNIMFTLIFGLITITIYDKEKRKWISIPSVAIVVFIGNLLRVDYGWFGILSVFIIYLFKNKKIGLIIAYIGLTTIYYYSIVGNLITETIYFYYVLFTSLSTIIMYLYNGKEGRKAKYFFYWFYPIHMLIIYLISLI